VNFGIQIANDQVREVRLAAWKPAAALPALSADQVVDAVIDALLSGDASFQTRQAMLAAASPVGTPRRVGELVAVALGSSDFQRR
jgi:hypothetical protein